MKHILASQQTENFKFQKQITQLLKDKIDLEHEISQAEQRVQQLEEQISGLAQNKKSNNEVLEELEQEFKMSERYTESQLAYKKFI